jgi:HEAT repeat protein
MTSQEIDQLFAQTLKGDYDDELPWEAVNALRRIGTKEVFDRAAAWCRSDHALERARGADILAQLGKTVDHQSNNFPEESYLVVSQLLLGEKASQPLSAAIHALGHLNNPAAIPLLSPYLRHPVAEVRFALACALGSFANHGEAIQLLIALISDTDDDVRDWAVFGLGNLGDGDSVEIRDALFSRLSDSNEKVREEAIVGLAKRKDTRVIPALLAALNQSELVKPSATTLTIEAAEAILEVDDERRDWGFADYAAALRERFPQ